MALREVVYSSTTYFLSYEILNQNKNETIVFLHGWGSNKEIMKQVFSSELDRFRLIFLDLPGFGASSVNQPIKTDDYAKIVKEFLNSLHVKVFSIVGHSFGGKVGALLNPKNLILLSSAGIVIDKSLKVRIKIKLFKAIKNIAPKSMCRFFISDDVNGMSRTMYEIFKSVVDEDFVPVFEKVTSKTLIFWGKEDSATPLKSGKEIHNTIKNSQFFPLDGDHFFFINNHKFIKKVMNEEL